MDYKFRKNETRYALQNIKPHSRSNKRKIEFEIFPANIYIVDRFVVASIWLINYLSLCIDVCVHAL